jgi:TetR/AcrR family transcriptional repressor of nem operon
LRQRLKAIFEEWRAPFASRIAEPLALGESGSFFSWEGAILGMKVEHSRPAQPLQGHRFRNRIFQIKFKE